MITTNVHSKGTLFSATIIALEKKNNNITLTRIRWQQYGRKIAPQQKRTKLQLIRTDKVIESIGAKHKRQSPFLSANTHLKYQIFIKLKYIKKTMQIKRE